jgi:hypothetical protein
MPSDPQAAELAALLRQMTALLQRQDKTDWAEKLDHCRVIIESSDPYGITRLLALFRGPASLNQMRLDHRGENDRFAALRTRAWAIAERIRKRGGSAR